jgi:dihydropteroate synthase-like protein
MKVVLATGRKAAGMVKDAVKAAAVSAPRITCEMLTQDLNIAAFSTPQSLRKALARYDESKKAEKRERNLILVSGFCTADFSELERELGIPIRLGPRHAYDISEALRFVEELELSPHTPADIFLAEKRRANAKQHLDDLERGVSETFSIKGVKIGGGARMKVCAELVDATLMAEDEIHRMAAHYLQSGADILDIGVHIGAKPEEVARAVQTAVSFAPDVPISLDTLDPELIRVGVENGVDMVLSLNKDNIPEVGAEVAERAVAAVVIPEESEGAEHKSNESLRANLKLAEEHGITRIIADPVLNTIGYGLAESIYNYYRFRLQDTSTPLFFGVGNVTELTDADSLGINVTLAGIASELSADILFTPECSDKARGSVQELRIASEMMLLAKARGSAPKDVGIDLLTLKEKRRKPVKSIPHDEKLVVAKRNETWNLDPKGCFRIAIGSVEGTGQDDKKICAQHSPSGRRIIGTSAQEILDTILRLDLVSRLEHASYLGKELAKAELALRLDRSYEQDEALL